MNCKFGEVPKHMLFETADTYLELVGKITGLFGRQPELPEMGIQRCGF